MVCGGIKKKSPLWALAETVAENQPMVLLGCGRGLPKDTKIPSRPDRTQRRAKHETPSTPSLRKDPAVARHYNEAGGCLANIYTPIPKQRTARSAIKKRQATHGGKNQYGR